ncbi:uncharacterized protein si:ch211-127m7.2 [Xyrichtys novacula]|uniref:Uncharacterized protein si:ch211-127m7.2 n=1 Tax=Xyrichtys novacula TaxID=13765 RepID=A0AAV1F768_XYRNO|nr:uncharacterized protein si:ch211-127m7.2 [Xyrichtys novacula]
MTERHRALPPWMAKKEGKGIEKERLNTRKRRTARAVFYCMNERELVQAAVSYLSNLPAVDAVHVAEQEVQDKAVDESAKITEKPATAKQLPEVLQDELSDCGEDQESTYVSETDMDITEVETVPYTRSPQYQGAVGQRSGPAQGKTEEEHAQMPTDAAEEDDDLRLVREIFFAS